MKAAGVHLTAQERLAKRGVSSAKRPASSRTADSWLSKYVIEQGNTNSSYVSRSRVLHSSPSFLCPQLFPAAFTSSSRALSEQR